MSKCLLVGQAAPAKCRSGAAARIKQVARPDASPKLLGRAAKFRRPQRSLLRALPLPLGAGPRPAKRPRCPRRHGSPRVWPAPLGPWARAPEIIDVNRNGSVRRSIHRMLRLEASTDKGGPFWCVPARHYSIKVITKYQRFDSTPQIRCNLANGFPAVRGRQ